MEDPIAQPQSSGKNSDRKKESDFNPVQLTRLVDPVIKPTKIEYDVQGVPERYKKDLAKGIGTVPLVYYNGVQLEYTDVTSLSLYHEGILPALKVTFRDSKGLFRGDGFPLDDTVITIFIYSRSRRLRSIYMDFKITSFKDLGGEFMVHGICNIPQMFIRKFSSYKSMTSFNALQEIAKECEIGFCSNVNDSDDEMTWVNIAKPRYSFIQDITKHSYLNDSSFLYCYVDYYYNLCYVDIEKELTRNITEDKMLINTGKGDIFGDNSLDEVITDMLITTDKGTLGTPAYVSKYKIFNLSTKISLNKAYLNRTKFYDSKNKELLMFDIDSISSEGDKIVLKGKPQDMDFYKENVDSKWVGKLDEWSDGEGNVHKNYNYAATQNGMNLKELDKISIECHLDHPNFNFYKLQKIPFHIIFDKPGGTQDGLTHKRISGECLITNSEIRFDGGKMSHVLTLVKRELEADDKEKAQAKKESDDQPSNNEVYENNDNPLPPEEESSEIDIIDDSVEIEEEADVEDDFNDIPLTNENEVVTEAVEVESEYTYVTSNTFDNNGQVSGISVIVSNNFNYPNFEQLFSHVTFTLESAEEQVKNTMDNFGEYKNNERYPKTGEIIQVRS